MGKALVLVIAILFGYLLTSLQFAGTKSCPKWLRDFVLNR